MELFPYNYYVPGFYGALALQSGLTYAAWYDNFMNLWAKNKVNPDVYPPDYKDAVKKDIVIAGKPETVTNEIKRQIDEAGLNYFVCRFAFGDLSYEESLSSLSLFRESVLPNF